MPCWLPLRERELGRDPWKFLSPVTWDGPMAARAAREHQSRCQPSPCRHPPVRAPEPSGEGSRGTRENFWTRWPGADWLGAHSPLQQRHQQQQSGGPWRWPSSTRRYGHGDAPVHLPGRVGERRPGAAASSSRHPVGGYTQRRGCCSHAGWLDHPDPSSCH